MRDADGGEVRMARILAAARSRKREDRRVASTHVLDARGRGWSPTRLHGRPSDGRSPMSKTRLLGVSGALVAAALIGGTIISAVSAASPAPAAATDPAVGAGAAGAAAPANGAAGAV